MPILPMISATKTLDKVLCLACDIKHSSFEDGAFHICNDTVEHKRAVDDETTLTYQPCPFSFNMPSQSETDDSNFTITNVSLIASNILKAADNSFEDITIQCWLIVANYDGTSNWLDIGSYIFNTQQIETVETITGTLTVDSCFQVNAGRFRGDNPTIFINLNHR